MELTSNSLNPNKRLKEEFVSNLTSSSILEIAALSAIIPSLFVLRQWSCSAPVSGSMYAKEVEKKKDGEWSVKKEWRRCAVSMVVDFFCVVAPVILVFTVLSEWAYHCAIFLILVLLFSISAKRPRCSISDFKEGKESISSLRTSILSYRVSVVLMTCICILAVDFQIYPRRYAKAEAYGTGLMDLGVGSFVVANSLVSREARGVMSTEWKSALRSICPLVFLGFGRLISTIGVDYQVHVGEYGVHWNFFFTLAAVHVGEYGVHWNFFFTLAAVSILTSIFKVHPKYCGIFGLFVLIGYWGMYLIGVYLGYHIFFGNESPTKVGRMKWARIRVLVLSMFFWSLTIILDTYVERVSRRMCNLAYVTFVLAQNFQVLSVIMLSDFISGHKPLVLEEAYNQNLLGSFLLAKVLTGMVNMCTDTFSASSVAALCILFGYAFLLSVVVGFAWFNGIKFKLW